MTKGSPNRQGEHLNKGVGHNIEATGDKRKPAEEKNQLSTFHLKKNDIFEIFQGN
jgi:hypothetical protein